MIANLLSIAGTDPSGGAGIHADLKTFGALGAYGMAVVTALVAQNTTGVVALHEVPALFVAAQLDAVFSDVRVDAVKIGMLGNEAVILAVAAALDRYRPPNVVLDPVMVAKSGDRLLDPAAVEALRSVLVPRVDLVTPNLPEIASLLGEDEAVDTAAMASQGGRLVALGCRRVLVKGGHLAGDESADVLLDEHGCTTLRARRVATTADHGTGCTLSAAIAALRPGLPDWLAAVGAAKRYVTGALRAAGQLEVGHGHGPLHHFYALWPSPGTVSGLDAPVR